MENYERKYKEALEWMQSVYSGLHGATKEEAKHYFPELKDEDERIRKSIIKILTKIVVDTNYKELGIDFSLKDMVAWLEKQGKKKHIFNADDWYVSKVDDKIHNAKFIEKQGWEKPTDKVEPKFKVGDWIVNNNRKDVFLIKSIVNGYCTLEDIKGNIISPCLPPCESDSHIWTIEDAKEGDVLVVNNEVFIYAHRKQMYSIAVAHCFVDSAGGFYLDGEFGYTEKGNLIHPATKEQRDTLFAKLKELGYEWDSEKKELKKIESKKLDADKVIEWLDKQACLGWLEDIEVEKVIEQFKKDFRL